MLLASSFRTIALNTHHIQDHRMMDKTINSSHSGHRILECVIMPLSFIVLLVEAILGAVYYLLPSSIPSRTSLCLPSTTCERSQGRLLPKTAIASEHRDRTSLLLIPQEYLSFSRNNLSLPL